MQALSIQLQNSVLRGVLRRLHYPLEVMLVCVRWYASYPLSLRNLEEMMAERGIQVDHATVHRWALKCCRCWPRCFAGASVRWVAPGESMKRMSRSAVSGSIYTAPSTSSGTPWTSCSPLGAM